jgi:hypothetical protein
MSLPPGDRSASTTTPSVPTRKSASQVDHVARLLGSDVDAHELTLGHYSTGITFGVAEYKAVGLLASSRTRHAAQTSYHDCITLDTDPADTAAGLA